MKKLNNFLDKAPLWQLFIFGWIFTGAFTFLLFQYSDVLIGGTSSRAIVNLKIGGLMGVMFGLAFMLMFSMSRKSDKFWDYAKVVEELINKAETKESLQLIFDNEFQDLQKLQMGHPHGYKIKELHTVLKTKYQYIKT
jgi:hypothetical protein